MPLLAAALILLALGAVVLWLSRRQRQQAGLPAGRVIYADPKLWGQVEKPLFSARLNLTGKPDYLVDQGGLILPVEVKSGRTPSQPPDSHLFQLAAYCLLVEETFKVRPPYGILHYPKRTFAIDYTPELEAALAEILDEMRSWTGKRSVPRSHNQASRCAGCGYRSICDERL
jgi:CRISPR-associated exonuclease Cas4